MVALRNPVGSPIHLGHLGFDQKLQKQRTISRLYLHNQKRYSSTSYILCIFSMTLTSFPFKKTSTVFFWRNKKHSRCWCFWRNWWQNNIKLPLAIIVKHMQWDCEWNFGKNENSVNKTIVPLTSYMWVSESAFILINLVLFGNSRHF